MSRRRWLSEEVTAPLDLRLAGLLAGVWAGTATALAAGPPWCRGTGRGVAAACALLALALWAVARFRQRTPTVGRPATVRQRTVRSVSASVPALSASVPALSAVVQSAVARPVVAQSAAVRQPRVRTASPRPARVQPATARPEVVRSSAAGPSPVRSWRREPGVRVLLAATAAGLAIGGLAVTSAADDPLITAAADGRSAVLTVRVTGPPTPVHSRFGAESGAADERSRADQRYRIPARAITADVGGSRWDSDVSVSITGTGEQWGTLPPGAVIRIRGALAPDDFPAVPGVALRTAADAEVVSDGSWWERGAGTVRAALGEYSQRMGGDAGALLPGLVVGDTSRIDARLVADAKTTGLTHLLAVSGSHFALVCGLTVLLLRRTVGLRVAALGGAVVLVGLVVLVGPEPSVLRAAVMGVVGIIAMLIGRSRTALPALCGAAAGLLLAVPELSVSIGFALSVAATAGLVLCAPVWIKALQRSGFPLGWASLLVIPVAAALATMPLIVLLSGSVSLAGVPANIAVAPAVPIALVLGLLSGVVGAMWPEGGWWLARASEPFLGWIAAVAHRLARLPQATVAWPGTLAGALLLATLIVLAAFALRHRRFRVLTVAAAAGALLVLAPAQALPPVGWPPPGWLIAGCEVGQGDAFVLSTDQPGTAVLIDTGPEPALVDACLDALGVGTIALLVVTHLHADHVGGITGALAGRSVGGIAVGPQRQPAADFTRLAAVARGSGVPLLAAEAGTTWAAAGVTLQLLGPAKAFHGTDSDANNDSVVLRAERAGVRMLLTGDIEPEAQRALLRQPDLLRADVLKVPHHGSAKDLPEFLGAVQPAVAMIGVGQRNDYGHPAPVLLRRLAGVGVDAVLRTDTDGDIAVGIVDGLLSQTRRGALLRAP